MRPTRAIAALTLAVITSSAGITVIAGFTGSSGGVAVRTSQPASTASRAMEATPEARTAPPASTSPATPPPAPLAPLPPGDGRDAPDPFLLEDGDRWVLYSTQVGLANVPVATTPDLATWSAPTDALPELPAWAEWGRTWAPGVPRRPGDFVLYFAARSRATGGQCIGAATSTSTTGPFISTSLEPLVCQPELGGSIDPHPFVDTNGRPLPAVEGRRQRHRPRQHPVLAAPAV